MENCFTYQILIKILQLKRKYSKIFKKHYTLKYEILLHLFKIHGKMKSTISVQFMKVLQIFSFITYFYKYKNIIYLFKYFQTHVLRYRNIFFHIICILCNFTF